MLQFKAISNPFYPIETVKTLLIVRNLINDLNILTLYLKATVGWYHPKCLLTHPAMDIHCYITPSHGHTLLYYTQPWRDKVILHPAIERRWYIAPSHGETWLYCIQPWRNMVIFHAAMARHGYIAPSHVETWLYCTQPLRDMVILHPAMERCGYIARSHGETRLYWTHLLLWPWFGNKL